MSTEIVTYDQASTPAALMHQATDVAGVCAEIVKRTARHIQGRKYVQVEGWQSIAATYGCIASSTKVEKVEGGTKAVGELRRISDGALLATAEGFVGEDEPTWYGGELRGKVLPKRADFAIRAMAQTRAISRVCRTAFAFVVVMIDSKLGTTPAEEMEPEADWTQGQRTESAPPPATPPSADSPVIPTAGGAEAAPRFINADQAIALEDRCKEVGVTVGAFCNQAKITRISQLFASRYDGAMTWLDSHDKELVR